jgi:subtilisin-like proprotein convertase family protein
LARTAFKNDSTHSDWALNGAINPYTGQNYHVNHSYGFGSIDAAAATAYARVFSPVGPQNEYSSGINPVNRAIPDNSSIGITDTLTIQNSGIQYIEYLQISISLNHPEAGNLEIVLQSSNGSSSTLTEVHSCYSSDLISVVPCSYFTGGNTFTFGSARHLDEPADGNWTLTVRDRQAGNTGSFVSWRLTIYGRNQQ